MAEDRGLDPFAEVYIMIGGCPDDWGLITSFLSIEDPRSAIEQFDAHYISGWRHFEGFSFDMDEGRLTYPGDPPMKPISALMFRNERIVLFDHAWVMVIQEDNTWQISRMD